MAEEGSPNGKGMDGFSAKIDLLIHVLGIVATVVAIQGCEPENHDNKDPDVPGHLTGFPDFITPSEKYFDVRINGIPDIDPESYRLKISGAIDQPATFSLEDLRNQDMIETTSTIECIGNRTNWELIGTATWKGFRIYDLVESLGIKEGALNLNYRCADGYYTYNTLEEDHASRYRTDSSIAIDSKIFFPVDNEKYSPGEDSDIFDGINSWPAVTIFVE